MTGIISGEGVVESKNTSQDDHASMESAEFAYLLRNWVIISLRKDLYDAGCLYDGTSVTPTDFAGGKTARDFLQIK